MRFSEVIVFIHKCVGEHCDFLEQTVFVNEECGQKKGGGRSVGPPLIECSIYVEFSAAVALFVKGGNSTGQGLSSFLVCVICKERSHQGEQR